MTPCLIVFAAEFVPVRVVMTLSRLCIKLSRLSLQAKRKQDAARMKERTIENARETLRKDARKQILELERNIWKSVGMSAKPLVADGERDESAGAKRSESGRSTKSDKPVDHGDINILPGQVG